MKRNETKVACGVLIENILDFSSSRVESDQAELSQASYLESIVACFCGEKEQIRRRSSLGLQSLKRVSLFIPTPFLTLDGRDEYALFGQSVGQL